MGLRARIEKVQAEAEARCQGCRQCQWGGIVPCPTQSRPVVRVAWQRQGTTKDMTGSVR